MSDNLLLSPTVMLRMRLKIKCPQVWNQLTAALSVHGAIVDANSGNGVYTDEGVGRPEPSRRYHVWCSPMEMHLAASAPRQT